MGQRRQELVLRPVGRVHLRVGARVLDRQRRAVGDVLREPEVGVGVLAARLGVHERQRAEGAAVRDQRHHDHRPDRQRAHRAQVLGVAGAGHQHRVGDHRVQHRRGGADHVLDAAARVRIVGIAILQRARHLDAGRVDVRDRQPLDAPLLVDDVDGAPVGDVRNGELGHGPQRRLVVERAAEGAAGLGQERGLPVRPLRPLAALLLQLVQLGGGDRRGGEVGQRARRLHFDVRELVARAEVEHQRAGGVPGDLQRDREHRLDAFGAVGLDALREHRDGVHRFGDQRLGERDRRDLIALIAADDAIGKGLGHVVRGADVPPLRGRVEAPERVAVGRNQRPRQHDDARQHVLDRRRAEQRARRRDQRDEALLQVGLPALGLFERAHPRIASALEPRCVD